MSPSRFPDFESAMLRDADEIREDRLQVDDAHEIAHRRRGESHRIAAVANGAEPEHSLAGRLAVGQTLEEQVVAPENRELER